MIVDILHLFVFVVTGLRHACFEPHHPLAAVGAEPAAAAEQERKRIAGLAQQQQQPFSFWFVALFSSSIVLSWFNIFVCATQHCTVRI